MNRLLNQTLNRLTCPRLLAATATLLLAATAHAGTEVAVCELASLAGDGPVTVYYPTQATAVPLRRGPFTLQLSDCGAPARGNGRLVVLSHGSGGGPWVHANLARSLVDAGFVVAMPQHRGDNSTDDGRPGPDSWAQRPAEVSRAIDTVGRDPRLAPLLQLDRVGAYGFSAGGHTALSLAGGSWSPAAFNAHCQAHLAEDFQSCVGLITRLTGGWLDSVKQWVALTVLGWKFDDATPQVHHDPRIAAVVAAAPLAADFEMASLAAPRVPLALVTLGQDRWLIPRFHSDRVVAACISCEVIANLPTAGHGAMLSPLPPGFSGLLGDMLNDPPGFDRGLLPAVDQKISAFFSRHLLQ